MKYYYKLIILTWALICSFCSFSAEKQMIEVDKYRPDKLDSIKYYNWAIYRAKAELHLEDLKFQQEKYRSYVHNLGHIQMRYKWHAWTSDAIFILVVLIVVSGLVFSAIQFSIGLKKAKSIPSTVKFVGKANSGIPLTSPLSNTAIAVADPTSANANAGAPIEPSASQLDAGQTTFKVSTTGIEVSSSILGIIILAISIAFFYLYLTIVYPLKFDSDNDKQAGKTEIYRDSVLIKSVITNGEIKSDTFRNAKHTRKEEK